ncbi:MAG: divergent polysaccharide deacetylase family protein [Candidatus Eiseniibacteriota bacterium]
MPKRKKKSRLPSPRTVFLLAAGAALLFLAGEAWKLARSDSGRVLLAARFGFGDHARITQIVGREIRRGLLASGVPPDSIRESVGTGEAAVDWRVGLRPDASLIQTNYALHQFMANAGAEVLDGAERAGPHGETIVTLRIGLPHRPLHQVRLVRARAPREGEAREPARVALVMYGFTDVADQADAWFALPVPYAATILPAGPSSARLFRSAAAHQREVVLHLPLEPLQYPRVDPGPGTVLVTMSPSRITALLRRHLDQAGAVVAVANHMGSLATQDMTVMTAIYRELKRRGLPFLHVRPAAGAVCKSLASNVGVIYLEPDVVLDAETRGDSAHALDLAWNAALERARARGHLVVMMRATPLARTWLASATSARRLEGVNLVPLSALIGRPVVP